MSQLSPGHFRCWGELALSGLMRYSHSQCRIESSKPKALYDLQQLVQGSGDPVFGSKAHELLHRLTVVENDHCGHALDVVLAGGCVIIVDVQLGDLGPAGILIGQLLNDENLVAKRTRALIESRAATEKIQAAWSAMDPAAKEAMPDTYDAVLKAMKTGDDETIAAIEAFRQGIRGSGWLDTKLVRTMDRIKSTDVEGIVLFCAGAFARDDLLGTVSDSFSQ